jgi:hypothetical protein
MDERATICSVPTSDLSLVGWEWYIAVDGFGGVQRWHSSRICHIASLTPCHLGAWSASRHFVLPMLKLSLGSYSLAHSKPLPREWCFSRSAQGKGSHSSTATYAVAQRCGDLIFDEYRARHPMIPPASRQSMLPSFPADISPRLRFARVLPSPSGLDYSSFTNNAGAAISAKCNTIEPTIYPYRFHCPGVTQPGNRTLNLGRAV